MRSSWLLRKGDVGPELLPPENPPPGGDDSRQPPHVVELPNHAAEAQPVGRREVPEIDDEEPCARLGVVLPQVRLELEVLESAVLAAVGEPDEREVAEEREPASEARAEHGALELPRLEVDAAEPTAPRVDEPEAALVPSRRVRHRQA